MDEEIDRLVVGVRADTTGFARDVATLRTTLSDGLGQGADLAARGIETGLLRAVKTGRLGFEDLKKIALSVFAEIAASASQSGGAGIFGGGGGIAGLIGLLGGVIGAPGRATGGPVSPMRAYRVGETGPELFVPTTSGQIVAGGTGGARDVRVAITINAGGGEAPRALAQSSRQIARAVKAAIDGAGG
ncbi:MAG: tail tape measure protein [Sphingomonas sp. 28-66-16]|nr:MAG: tail tape measure protein [Sphingomonas sp. 28-66-16]